MKIGYFADGFWALPTLQALLQHSDLNICFLVSRSHGSDPILDPIANDAKIPILRPLNINSPESIKNFAAYEADLYLSMSFLQKFSVELCQQPLLGCYNAHASLLPQYRGRNSINWAMIQGEDTLGVTIHKMDEQYDHGDVIKQSQLKIEPNEQFDSTLHRMASLCAQTVEEWLTEVPFQTHGTPQDKLGQASYFQQRGPGDEWFLWDNSAQNIHNFIRAVAKPGPYAHTKVNGQTIQILCSEILDTSNRSQTTTPGELLQQEGRKLWVATRDHDILIETKGFHTF